MQPLLRLAKLGALPIRSDEFSSMRPFQISTTPPDSPTQGAWIYVYRIALRRLLLFGGWAIFVLGYVKCESQCSCSALWNGQPKTLLGFTNHDFGEEGISLRKILGYTHSKDLLNLGVVLRTALLFRRCGFPRRQKGIVEWRKQLAALFQCHIHYSRSLGVQTPVAKRLILCGALFRCWYKEPVN